MKNIHILPTDKPSRLYRNLLTDKLFILENSFMDVSECNREYQHIYITSDETPKEGDWVYTPNKTIMLVTAKYATESSFMIGNSKHEKSPYYIEFCRKIILTTDQELINDGVQRIRDEFLEWFVKNPTYEEIEVGYGWIRLTETNNEGYWVSIPDNQFEMQQAEPKQECTCENPTDNTCGYCEKENKIKILEEAKKRAKNYMSLKGALEPKQETLELPVEINFANEIEQISEYDKGRWYGRIEGAKYMSERMYSEEEVLDILRKSHSIEQTSKMDSWITKWLEQFKKK
jgi:hypothetical protein